MLDIGIPELLIILFIIILIFGVGRISKVAGELGTAIRSFREGLKDDKEPGGEEPNVNVKTETGKKA